MRTNSAVWLKTPKYFDLLVWGDFVVGLALIGLAALLIIVLLIGLKQPPEYRQYATLLAPGDIAWSAISLACGLYLTRTPHRLGTAGTVKQLRGSAKRLMVINGFILVGVLIYIPKIATSLQAGGSQFGLQAACMLGALFLCTVNVMSLNWLNKNA